MANKVLFLSSVILGTVNICFLLFHHPVQSDLLFVNIFLGVVTSIWNHGVTMDVIKIFDRIMMVFGFLSELYLILTMSYSFYWYKIGSGCLLFSAGGFYIFSKIILRNFVTNKNRNPIWISSCRYLELSLHIHDIPHMIAHFVLTLNHCVLLVPFSGRNRIV